MRKVKLGLLGLGTIGSGVLKVLSQNADIIKRREGLDIDVCRVLVRTNPRNAPWRLIPQY